MAFVSQSKRNFETTLQINKANLKLGPGSYDIQYSSQNKHNTAPFSSSTSKQYNHPKEIIPGPGQYKISHPIGKPNIKTYSNSKSIIVRINSSQETFASKTIRFKSHQNIVPGPDIYDQNKSQKFSNKKIKKDIKKIVSSIKNTPSISQPRNLNPRPIKQPALSQTQLNKIINDKKGSLVGVWSKDKVQRFSRSKKKCLTEIGPGKYDIYQSSTKPKSSYNFISNTVKSIFDTIVYDTQNKTTLQDRRNNNFKSEEPAPGTYDYQSYYYRQQNQRYKNRSFGSKKIRFQDKINQRNTLPFYNQDNQNGKISFNKKKIAFNSQTKKQYDIIKDKVNFPGPGQYQNDYKGIINKIRPKIQNFGSFVQRPIFAQQQMQKIGPGYYSLQPKKRKQQQQHESMIFKSKRPRIQTQPSKSLSSINYKIYDIQSDDISRKLLKQKNYRQNLMKINCQKPAFDNQLPRFKHYQQQSNKIPNIKQIINYHTNIIREKIENKRQKLINQSKKQIYQNKGCSIGRGGQRFKQSKKGPGVGDYSIRQKWNKKSYNIKYNKK